MVVDPLFFTILALVCNISHLHLGGGSLNYHDNQSFELLLILGSSLQTSVHFGKCASLSGAWGNGDPADVQYLRLPGVIKSCSFRKSRKVNCIKVLKAAFID